MRTLVRRLFWLGLLGGAGAVLWSTRRRRQEGASAGAPVWPPFEPEVTATPPVAPAAFAAAPAAEPDVPRDGVPDVVTVVEPLDPDDGSADAAHAHRQRWVPAVDGRCPDGYPIKANDNSKIFHLPGGRFYDRTVPERCYADAADAEADGYRRAKA